MAAVRRSICIPIRFECLKPIFHLYNFIPHTCRLFIILTVDQTHLFFVKFFYFGFKLYKFGRLFGFLNFLSCAGFIKNIDCLIGEKTLRHISARHFHNRRNNSFIVKYVVKVLILLFYSLQNIDCLGIRRLINFYRLKTPLKRGIFFDIAGIFFCSRRSDNLNLAAA